MTYESFISLIEDRNLSGQYTYYLSGVNRDVPSYYLFAYDGPHIFEVDIQDTPSVNDFEGKYKNNWNKPIAPIESGTGFIMIKPKPVDGTLYLNNIYFMLGDANSIDCPDGLWSMTVEDGENDMKITKVYGNPNFGYYIDGGGIRILGDSAPHIPIKLDFVMAPNIPSEYGGNVKFVANKKLKITNEWFNVFVPPKYVKYYPENPYANQVLLKCTHHLYDSDIELELFVNFYK